MAAATLQMNAFGQTNGIVVLGGDDLNAHGSRSGSVNVTGWLYIENVLRSMAPQIRRAGPFTVDIVQLGSTSAPVTSGGNAGAAGLSAAMNAGMTISHIDGAAGITQFFANLAAGTVNPKIIYLPGNDASNDLDASEEAALAANAQAINGFVASGGGLFSHIGAYSWLAALLPGITVDGACDDNTLTFTAAGTAFLPSLTVNDIRSGPCHGNFRGNLGALQILVRDGNNNAVVIGGVPVGGGGITPGNSHSIPCFSGPITTDQPVHFQFTSALTAPVHFTMTPGNIANGLTLNSAGVLSGTPRAAGSYLYTIAAGGAGGTTDHIQCRLQVNPPAAPSPTLTISTACPLPTGVVGNAYSQTLSTSGGTQPITLSISTGALPAGLTLTGATISGSPTGAGTATFTILATDSANPAQTATRSCSIAVSATPVQPTITSACPVGPGTVNGPYHANLTATGDLPISWSLAAGSLPVGVVLHSNGSISGIPHHGGTFNYTLRASNAAGSATQACTLVINDPAAPPPPPPATLSISTACPLNSGVVGSAFSQSLGSTGGTGAVTFSISAGALPLGLTLTGSTISGSPTTAATASFTIQATDSGSPVQTATRSCSMTVNAAPTGPAITTACPLTQGVVGQPYHLNLAATGTSPITWSTTAGSLPIGMALFSSGLLTGVPHHAGTYNFTLQATNSVTSVTQACSLVILLHAAPPPPPGPAITACPASSAVIGTAYSQTLSTTGTTPITLSIQSGALPTGLTLTGNTISGTPTGAAGTSNFVLLATDSGNPVQTGTRSCSIAVSVAPPPPVGPTITTACPLPSGRVGTPVHLNLTATGDSPITWSLTNGTLPLGVTLASTGALSGTPHHDGTFQFTVRAANNTGSALLTCTWAIGLHSIPPPPGGPTAPSITTGCPLPQGTVGSSYSQSFSTTGGTPIFTYAVTAGALPVGLSLSSSGTLSGTPSAQGTANFTVTVTDSGGPAQTNSLACSVVINAAPIVPPAAVAPTISTACPLPNGVVGAPYSLTLASTGGASPYTYAMAAGSLPTPLTLSSGGIISGAPNHHGSYHFTFRVTGNDGASSMKSCTMTVLQHAPAVTSRGAVRYGLEDAKGVVPMTFELEEALPYDVTGRFFMVTRRFAGEESDLVGFNTGGREADFTIKAGDTKAQFLIHNFGAQVGDRGAEMVLMVVLEGGDSKIVVDLSGTERVPTRADQ